MLMNYIKVMVGNFIEARNSKLPLKALIYINDWIAHCVLNCQQAVKPPEAFEGPSYDSLLTEGIISCIPIQKLHPSKASKVGKSVVKWDGLVYRGLFLSPSNCDSCCWWVAVMFALDFSESYIKLSENKTV